MAEQINVYQGDRVQVVSLDPEKGLSFGEDAKCDYTLPKGSCAGNIIRFYRQDGVWKVSCKGNVMCAGESIQNETARVGELYVLNNASRLAVQLTHQENRIAAQIPLEDLTEVLIGRGTNATLQLSNPRVSGGHAKIYRITDGWRICDIKSTNGTFVNGKRITDQALCEGDQVNIGPYQLYLSNGMLQVCGEASTVKLHLPEKRERPSGQYPYFTRSPRLLQDAPSGKVEIEAAPGIGGKPTINWLSVLLPSVGTAVITVVMTLAMGMSPMTMAFSVPMALISVLLAVVNYRSQVKKYSQTEQLRLDKYQQYIHSCEEKLEEATRQQRDAALSSNPTLQQCLGMVRRIDRRLWERTNSDDDFLAVRVGLGEAPLNVEIQIPKVGFVLEEDTFTRTPEQLAEKYRIVTGMPVVCDLLHMPTLGVTGKRSHTISAVHALTTQLVTHHGYDEVKLVVLYPETERGQWEWMRWLPHTYNENRTLRYMACTQYDAVQMLASLEEEFKHRASVSGSQWGKALVSVPHYVFLVAEPALLQNQPLGDYLLRNDPSLGASMVLLAGGLSELPRNIMQILDARSSGSELYPRERTKERKVLQLDQLSLQDCDALARAMAPIRLPEKNSAQLLPENVSFLQGYRVQRPDQIDLGDYWSNACNYQSMSVPIGVKANGETFYFDIHEKVHGPHGLVAGMTGSGKSEMVQSWILSMALQFSPKDVSFVLIDFKGTGLIQPFKNLPHLAGTISDLDANITRNLVALKSELQRRKALFDSAGVNKISDYLKLYRSGRVAESLSYLFVVIDEYAEFKKQFPDFTSEVNTLFRTGRALGVHIILLTQNPAGVVSGESESNVRFRWCLKVANAAASKEVLGGHSEASRIPNPGRAYVRVGDDEVFELIQSFYSGAAYQPDRTQQVQAEPVIAQVALNGSRIRAKNQAGSKKTVRGSEIDAIVNYIQDYTTRKGIAHARHIWENRMPGEIFLPDLLKNAESSKRGELTPVVGLLDDPVAQTQRPLYLPLSRDGHVAVYGASGSGKTVFLQTVAASICSQYSPEQANLYIMDFGAWSLGMFKDFPHVTIAANSNEEEKIFAIAQKLEQELQMRKEVFAREGVGNLRTYLNATGKNMPYLVLLVDNFDPVYHLYPKLDDFFVKLGREGGNYGIFLVATCSSTMALGHKLKQSVNTSIVLQMTDYSEYSSVIGKTDGLIPEKLPGRGLFREKRVMEFQTALPAAMEADGTYLRAIRTLGDALGARWGKRNADTVFVMPDVVKFGTVQAKHGGVVLGLSVDKLEAVEVSLTKPHHLLISGLPKSGKTTMMRTILKQLIKQENADIILHGNTEEYGELAACVKVLRSGAEADTILAALSKELGRRQERKNADSESCFDPIYILVDGYKEFFEVVEQQSISRLRALLMMGSGLGVSLIVADDAGNLSTLKQFMEPVTMLLSNGPAVLLGGSALDHLAIETGLEAGKKNQLLKAKEGWYKSEEGALCFKAMNCN